MIKQFIIAATSISCILATTTIADANALLKRSRNSTLTDKQLIGSGIPPSDLQSIYKILTNVFESKNKVGIKSQLCMKNCVDHFMAYEVNSLKLLEYMVGGRSTGSDNDLVKIELDVILRYYDPEPSFYAGSVSGKPPWKFTAEKHDIKKVILRKIKGIWKLDDNQFSNYVD